MKVLFLNTYARSGGAAIAARRLFKALGKITEGTFCVLNNNNDRTVNTPFPEKQSLRRYWINLALEKAHFYFFEKDKSHRFAFSTAMIGISPRNLPDIEKCDVIHIHWLNQGFLSLKGIEKILQYGKPVVWTLHDMWSFTGGCHYAGTCNHYQHSCGNCMYLKYPGTNDLSARLHAKKKVLYEKYNNLTFVTCSNWLAETARKSSLVGTKRVLSIPNAIDTNYFKPADKESIRLELSLPLTKKILLFGSAKLTDKRKGLDKLLGALQILSSGNKELHEKIFILLFGQIDPQILDQIPFENLSLGSIPDPLKAYQAADTFILPSLEDNLPNTIMEALSCGLPCLAFKTGGIPEMVDHRENGYLCNETTSQSLARGIRWMMEEADLTELGNAARTKAETCYSEEVVSQRYFDLYRQLHGE